MCGNDIEYLLLVTVDLSILYIKLLTQAIENYAKRAGNMLLLCFVLCIAFSPCAYAIDIITNKSSSSQKFEYLTNRELRAIFSLRLKQWPDGLPVTVVTMPNNSTVHKEFCKKILNIFPHQLKGGWDRVTYSGLGQPPIVAKTKEEMIDILKRTPGAIGYTDRLYDNDLNSVKRVELDVKRTTMR
ncbi:MAG: hypothetical protein D6B28_04530 [Gammaproteobacteria bacterium]|nr:MAG: hypothetical protein D6B28_04530 [Gammaproteobacteria bacterium]